MSSTNPLPSTDQRPELVFALVGGAGTRLNDLSDALKSKLRMFGYQTVDIRLSDLLVNFTGWSEQSGTSKFDSIRHRQNMGNAFREQLHRGDAMALAGIMELQATRAKILANRDKAVSPRAYILHQLKHPAEVDLLRTVYGSSFLLIAGHAPRNDRMLGLARQMAESARQSGQENHYIDQASKVIEIDQKEDDIFGQNVRDTYPQADFFANLGKPEGQFEVWRFVELLFGHPAHTPLPDEYAMYNAHAVSLRSSDDNRQVGAVILSIDDPLNINNLRKADVIAVGMNEVPRGGGGLYWENATPDSRDQYLLANRENRAAAIKISVLTELIERIIEKKWLQEAIARKPSSELADILLENLKGTQFLNIGEFSRPVHAEMAALIDAARRGVAVDGHSMYVTTFPCHNCAKHIIAAGIRRVVYLEPYPKSRTVSLYREEINPESLLGKEEDRKVVFFAFTGIAPRQYGQLFSMAERGAKKGNSLPKWNWDAEHNSLSPLYVTRNASSLYLAAEDQELKSLPHDIYHRPT